MSNHETSQKPGFFKRLDHFVKEAFGNEESEYYRIINDIVVIFIFLAILVVMMESVESFKAKYETYLKFTEMIIVAVFTVEYIANIYATKSKKKYIFGIWGIIDLLAIIPSYVTFINLTAIKSARIIRVLRFLRLMRMMRLLKLSKKAGAEYENSKEQKVDTLKMDLQIYFIALFAVLIILSTFQYYIEHIIPVFAAANPDSWIANSVFFKSLTATAVPTGDFSSIPRAMWWCIVTLTTVGYGDIYPLTPAGRILGGLAMLCGVALFGMMMNVIGKSMMSSLFGAANLDDVEAQKKEAEEVMGERK